MNSVEIFYSNFSLQLPEKLKILLLLHQPLVQTDLQMFHTIQKTPTQMRIQGGKAQKIHQLIDRAKYFTPLRGKNVEAIKQNVQMTIFFYQIPGIF